MHKRRILVVDDDRGMLKLVSTTLQSNGFEILTASGCTEAIQLIQQELPDLIILDILLPVSDGFDVCSRVREWSQVPIIILSALDDEGTKVKCFELGADDYLTKPFGIRELRARIKAVLRRAESHGEMSPLPTFVSDDLEVDFVRRTVKVANCVVELTPTEYCLLKELVLNAGKVLTYDHLLQRVWGSDYRDEREYLYVYMRRLRIKLEPKLRNGKRITTVPGIGYKYKEN